MSPENKFYDSFGQIAVRGLRGRLKPDQIEAETVAQIRRLQNSGVTVSHVDTHKHAHMLPQVAEAVIRGAVACSVKAIRNPFIPLTGSVFTHIARRPHLWKRYTGISLLRGYNHDFRRRAEKAGLATPDGSFGVVMTGSVNENVFRAAIKSIPDGTWEFVCHPGYNDDELQHVKTKLRESREKEFHILTSDWAKKLLAEHGVQLISFRELAAG